MAKILLDENIPVAFSVLFGDAEVETVAGRGWFGKKNGELLSLMQFGGFGVLVTNDKNLSYQHKLEKYGVQVVVLNSPNNRRETLEIYATKAAARLKAGLGNVWVVWID